MTLSPVHLSIHFYLQSAPFLHKTLSIRIFSLHLVTVLCKQPITGQTSVFTIHVIIANIQGNLKANAVIESEEINLIRELGGGGGKGINL